MKKVYLKRIIKIICFLIVLIFMLNIVNRVLILKRGDGITPMQNLYSQEYNTVDVLIIGSSHAGMNLDTEEMWKDYGISSYVLWGSVQPMWNSYYNLKEALKTQKPKVVVLEMFAVATDVTEYSDESRQVSNICGMRSNMNKWQDIKVSAPRDRWLDLALGLPIYHSRYNELTENDFQHFSWSKEIINDKGTSYRYGTEECELLDVSGIEGRKAISEKQQKYLFEIIELLRERNIPLVMITTPTSSREYEQEVYNTVRDIAIDNNIPYYNFNLMDKLTDFDSKDFWTDGGHINTSGARKISKWLGNELQVMYELEDHRGDKKYKSWEKNMHDVQNGYIAEISDRRDYFKELARDDKVVFLVKNSSWELSEEYERLLDDMKCANIDVSQLTEGGTWLVSSTTTGEMVKQDLVDMHSDFVFDDKKFEADFRDGTGVRIDGNVEYMLAGPGIICIVYDKYTNECVDVTEFLLDDGFEMKHYTGYEDGQ